jgi:hypothetical protein
VVALDGKALRRAYERGQSHMPPVMVTAWSAMTRMALVNVLAPAIRWVSEQPGSLRGYADSSCPSLPDALPELVFSMLAPLYELFDFFQLPKRLVEQELVSMHRNTFPH